jgi:hypothetical protein
MTARQRAALEDLKQLLREVHFDKAFITDQSAICLLALSDSTFGREGLLPGKRALRDGGRINNILEYCRNDLETKVAENTRESYRKSSLKPLMRGGVIRAHQTSVNDPNTYYKIDPAFLLIIDEKGASRRALLISEWILAHSTRLEENENAASLDQVIIAFESQEIRLSPGKHNQLIKAMVERLAPAFIGDFTVLYIGDAADKMLYANANKLSDLLLSLDIHDKLPDVILLNRDAIFVMESVTSVGPVSNVRRAEIDAILEKHQPLTLQVVYTTAFPDRETFRRFVSEIAWNSYVWIANEGLGIIHFDTLV